MTSSENTVSLNSVTNKLIYEYDKQFNINYNDIVQLNSTIQNKDEIIIQTNQVILQKEKYIIALQYLFIYSIIFFIVTLLHATKDIPFNNYIGIVIFFAFIFMISCYYYINTYFNIFNVSKKFKELKAGTMKYAKDIFEEDLAVSPYECPNTCKNKDDNDDDNDDDIGGGDGSLLKVDPTTNIWKKGDYPIQSGADGTITDINPKSSFDSSYPSTTYYKCKWLGNNTIGNMPDKLKKSNNIYSSIPCSYRPNTTELGRWFCNENPNTYDPEKFDEICQKH